MHCITQTEYMDKKFVKLSPAIQPLITEAEIVKLTSWRKQKMTHLTTQKMPVMLVKKKNPLRSIHT